MLKRAKARWGLLNCSWLCQNAQHCTTKHGRSCFLLFFLAAVGAPASNGLLHCIAQLSGGVVAANGFDGRLFRSVMRGHARSRYGLQGSQNLCVNLCILLNVKCQQMHAFNIFNSLPHSRLMCCLALFCGVLPYVSFRCMLPLQSPTTLEF